MGLWYGILTSPHASVGSLLSFTGCTDAPDKTANGPRAIHEHIGGDINGACIYTEAYIYH